MIIMVEMVVIARIPEPIMMALRMEVPGFTPKQMPMMQMMMGMRTILLRFEIQLKMLTRMSISVLSYCRLLPIYQCALPLEPSVPKGANGLLPK